MHLNSTDTFEVLKLTRLKYLDNTWTNSTDTFEVLKHISRRWFSSSCEIQPIHLKYWNFSSFLTSSIACFDSTDTFEVLKRLDTPAKIKSATNSTDTFEVLKQDYTCSVKHLFKFNRYIWSIETVLKVNSIFPWISIQPIHLKYWNLEKLMTLGVVLRFNRYIWSIETKPFFFSKLELFIQPIHLKYWNVGHSGMFSHCSVIQPIHLKYWNVIIAPFTTLPI